MKICAFSHQMVGFLRHDKMVWIIRVFFFSKLNRSLIYASVSLCWILWNHARVESFSTVHKPIPSIRIILLCCRNTHTTNTNEVKTRFRYLYGITRNSEILSKLLSLHVRNGCLASISFTLWANEVTLDSRVCECKIHRKCDNSKWNHCKWIMCFY